jgi:hypothetical protein
MPDPNQQDILNVLMGQNAPASFSDRLYALGSQPANIDDRTGTPVSPYQHMLGGNQMVREAFKHVYPYPFQNLNDIAENLFNPVSPRRPPGGQLPHDIGAYDITGGGR